MDLIALVRETIDRHALTLPGDTVVVAVSGGPDSLALLHVLRAMSQELGISLHIAHLNHQLRGPEADADAEFVARLGQEWNLPTTVEIRDVTTLARERRLSLEEAARHARYSFLAEVAQRVHARAIAVGHNADDQVETVLMHLLRGAGLAGLRAMSYKSRRGDSGAVIIRPLLDVSKSAIEDYCRQNSLTPRFDRSNLDTTLFRNRLRHQVLPYLETVNPNLRQVLRHTAQVLADDYELVQTQVEEAYARIARLEAGFIVFSRPAWRELPPALQRGTLRAAVRDLRSNLRDVDWTHIENARRVAMEKETGAAATLPGGLMLLLDYDRFSIGTADDIQSQRPLAGGPALAIEQIPLQPPGRVEMPESDWLVRTEIGESQPELQDRWTAVFDFQKCQGQISLRRRRPGDRFQPQGLKGHTQSVSEFMIDQKIPRAARDRLPMLVDQDHILWVCGWRIDERARVTSETRRYLMVKFERKVSGWKPTR